MTYFIKCEKSMLDYRRGQTVKFLGTAGYSKRSANEAAGSLDAEAYFCLYVEAFKRLRTKLGAFFSSLPRRTPCWQT